MSPRRRIASVSVASAAAVGLIVAAVVAPPAAAEPCTGAAADAQPLPNQAFRIPSPSNISPFNRPIGHMPAGANDGAPLPKLGLLPTILSALTPRAAQVQQQAAVVPTPKPAPAQQRAPAAQPVPAAAVPEPAPDRGHPTGTSLVGWVTGPDSPNNTIQKFAITGTDLGIMWDNGDPANHQVLMAFGDTNGYCGIPGKQWRYNTLMRSSDGALSKTVAVPDGVPNNKYSGSPVWKAGIAKQVINSINRAPDETGIIPTAGTSAGGHQYVNFMSIRDWNSPGSWTTNYSAIAMSSDNGESWGVYPGTIRTPDGGNANFQMGAFLKPGPGDPYLYSFGTPNGRGGAAYVSRVPPNLVPDLTKYEYWDGGTWVPGNPNAAVPVIPGPVGEMSAQYNTYLKQYVALYCNGPNDVVMRTAPAPQGPWGPEQVLVTSMEMPGGIYAPYLHPWSTGKELYYNLSLWSGYNVMLMHSTLS
jgi:Domain of unknown function (DUF4185)